MEMVEVIEWYKGNTQKVLDLYSKKIKVSFRKDTRIKFSLAYATILETALEDGLKISDCQINKIAMMICEEVENGTSNSKRVQGN